MSSRGDRQAPTQPSLVAVTLCVLIVAGAVLFGIFGPGIAQRSQLGGRLTLGELVGAAAMLGDGFLANALRSRVPSLRGADSTEALPSSESMRRSMKTALGVDRPVPDLARFGYEVSTAGPVVLRGEQPDAFALFYLSADRRRGVTMVLAPDDGRAVIFDEFGRPATLEPGRVVQEPLERFNRDESVALVWTDGTLLTIAILPSERDAMEMQTTLGAP